MEQLDKQLHLHLFKIEVQLENIDFLPFRAANIVAWFANNTLNQLQTKLNN